MTDTEKERELPEEGRNMDTENLVKLGEKKESSLAADQESVTGDKNPENSIDYSSTEESNSSIKKATGETSIDDAEGDSPAPEVPEKETEPLKEDPSIAPQVNTKEDIGETAPVHAENTGSENSGSDNNSDESLPPSADKNTMDQGEKKILEDLQEDEKDSETLTSNTEVSQKADQVQDQEAQTFTDEKKPEEITATPQSTEKETEVEEEKPEVHEKSTRDNEQQPQISERNSLKESDEVNIANEESKSESAGTDKETNLNEAPEPEVEIKRELVETSKNDEVEDKDASKEEDSKEEDAGKAEDTKEDIHPEAEIEDKDYSLLKKDELINEFEALLKISDLKLAERKIKELKPYYQEIVESERTEALKKFMDDGGAEIDFKYVGDALDSRYSNLNDKYKGRRNAYYSELEKSKEENLSQKQEILEKLRAIVDGEETNASISALKNITKEWRSVGPVPSAYAKSMWATYNILIDRFYDNRSIYFELKELDRKKNLESKLELCEKAEHLLDYEVIRDAVKELNELHEEFKHIGPVPKEMQEVVWQRFKSASDAIYNRRKDYVSGLKKELHENLELKKQLVDEVAKFDEFDSEKISDWNEKTKEILDLQKKWETIGGLPREHAKEINKHFWSSFKSFFNNKNKFFKKLESQRDENLLKKEELVKRAEELKNSSDWEKTADLMKELQREWKDIGPVPEKNRNEVYKKFKKACDTFFNKRREHSKEVESEYKVNLKKKEEICAEIEKMVEDKDKNIDRFKELQVMFNGIGFVPRNTIKRIQKKFSHATELFLNSFDLTETAKSELRFAAEVDKLKSSPNADKRIYRKEVEVKRLISKIENDIALWRNNIEFFAKSKTADKVREEFNEKIAKATSQLEELREELKVLNKI